MTLNYSKNVFYYALLIQKNISIYIIYKTPNNKLYIGTNHDIKESNFTVIKSTLSH